MTETQVWKKSPREQELKFELAAARIEVKQYRDSCDVLDEALTQCADANKDLSGRLIEAWAAIGRLKRYESDFKKLTIQHCGPKCACVREQREALADAEAERDAARAALAKIAEMNCMDVCWHFAHAVSLAKAALGQPAAQEMPYRSTQCEASTKCLCRRCQPAAQDTP